MAESSAYLYAKGKELVQREKLETEKEKGWPMEQSSWEMQKDGIQKILALPWREWDRHSSGTGAMAAKVTTDSRQQSSRFGQEVGRSVPTAVMVSVE